MDKEEAIRILSALAEGCNPATGEILEDNLFYQPEVLLALQFALDQLETGGGSPPENEIRLPDETMQQVIAALEEHQLKPTSSRVAKVLCGASPKELMPLFTHPLYNTFPRREERLLKIAAEKYFIAHIYPTEEAKAKNEIPDNPYFRENIFNKLSEKALGQLKERVDALGIHKPTEELPSYFRKQRETFPRFMEPWFQEEKDLLRKAMDYTNDLEILSGCFGRSKKSIEGTGLKMLEEEKGA